MDGTDEAGRRLLNLKRGAFIVVLLIVNVLRLGP